MPKTLRLPASPAHTAHANASPSPRRPHPVLSGLVLAVLAAPAFALPGPAAHLPFSGWVDTLLVIWFSLTALSVGYIAYDIFDYTPAMKVMKWGWLLVALYTGPVAFVVYWFSCREPAPGTHEKFVAPQWKQTVGSTIHCMAGDATGVIVAAAITALLHTPMWLDSIVEYVAGFLFGLFIFQALFMKDMLGGSYQGAVRATMLPEWLSMNGVMAGMIPTMVILMSHDAAAMHPGSLRFWGIMSLATLVGSAPAYPINWWLVKKGLKHGMGTERVLGRGGEPVPEKGLPAMAGAGDGHKGALNHQKMTHRLGMGQGGAGTSAMHGSGRGAAPEPGGDASMGGAHGQQVPARSKVIVALLSLLLLTIGLLVAARFGDFSMSAGRMTGQTMDNPSGMEMHMQE